jgi:hypothetical protein
VSIRPDDDPTIANGKVIDGEVIDSSIVDTPTVDDELTARLRALSMEIDDSPAELGEQTTATLHALAAEAGDPPPDLHHAVLVGAQRARRRRYAVTGLTALAVLAISGTVVASVSRASDQGTDRLTAAAPHSAMPLPTTDSVIAPPADAPSLTPSGSASPSAVASASASGVPGVPGLAPVGPGAPAAPGRPAPAPSGTKTGRPPAPLRVTVVTVPTSATKGDVVSFRMYWDDGDGRFGGTSADWNDGSTGEGGGSAVIERGCKSGPGKGVTELQHKFDTVGSFDVVLRLSTYNCTNYKLETATTTVHVDVSPAATPSGQAPGSPGVG